MDTERQPKVVVVDDEFGPRESLRMLLKNDYEVLCASSVDEGVGMVQREKPDLVIMDIRMPGKSGIEGLREVRAVDAQVSVVMLTGYGALETAQQALRLGATDYISKPFDTVEMQRIVHRYAQRSHLERKRARMLDELRAMNARLADDLLSKERLAAIGECSAEMLHDLRNPLTIVSGYVDLLASEIERTKSMNGQAGDYLQIIEQNVRRCVELAQMWQKFGRDKAPAPVRTLLQGVLDDIRKAAAPLASTARVQIEIDGDLGAACVRGIAPQLVRAIHNVVSNAIEAASPDCGRVGVLVAVEGDRAVITVTDNGCGMPPHVKARMFEPYFTTKAEGKGTGLGMVITRKIIDEHSGSIAVDSTEGRGTTVSISLPLLIEEGSAATSAA